jgi:hypothetical protein
MSILCLGRSLSCLLTLFLCLPGQAAEIDVLLPESEREGVIQYVAQVCSFSFCFVFEDS